MAGQGKRIYREWLTRVRQDAREMGQFTIENIQTQADLDEHYEQFLTDIELELDEQNNPNKELWLQRATQEVTVIKERLIKRFNIPDEQGAEPDDSESEDDRPSDSGEILGFTIVDEPFKVTIKGKGATRRTQIFTSLAALQEYTDGIPRGIIAGIEVVLNSKGEVKGYYVWVYDET